MSKYLCQNICEKVFMSKYLCLTVKKKNKKQKLINSKIIDYYGNNKKKLKSKLLYTKQHKYQITSMNNVN